MQLRKEDGEGAGVLKYLFLPEKRIKKYSNGYTGEGSVKKTKND